MYPSNRCLISLAPLNEANRQQGEYRNGEIAKLLGSHTYKMRLPFTRDEFITELPKKQQGMSISGYQPKLSLAINENGNLNVVDNKGIFILKPSPEEFPELATNEHATMSVMKFLGFETPDFGLVRFNGDDPDSELAFLIRRYDRTNNGDDAIHQEQLDAAMNIAEKYGKIKDDDEGYVSYEQACHFLIENIDSSLNFKKELFRRVLVAYFLGNNDFHLRNFGILHPQTSASILAPVYDFVSVAPYSHYISNETALALPLLAIEEGDNGNCSGRISHCTYTGFDFITFAKNIKLSEKIAKKMITDLCAKKDKILDIYRNSFMPEEDVEKVRQWIESRVNYLGYMEHVDI
ncbi:HipA domain-containing protein [Photobacterium japonica]|uniref:type II toxin-antitoxin system HipA family toxin n=1 Tax=Photobacterium japonica TaxID=2910235 RepID=UPI003D0BC741